jgi:hypothetical protein
MKMVMFPIKAEGIGRGLAPANNLLNNPFLVESIGAFPFEKIIQSLGRFTQIDVSTMGGIPGGAPLSFPYPQFFVFSDVFVLCTEDAIYEYDPYASPVPTLTLMIDRLTPGVTWDCVDFKSFLYFTNGMTAVVKQPNTGDYVVDTTIGYGRCVCNFNGQILMGNSSV